ncbi:MAG: helix-turn-helix domain-containing protein [Bacteriovoracia bacterium]
MKQVFEEILDTAREPHHLREAIKKAGNRAYSTSFCIDLNQKAIELIRASQSLEFIDAIHEIIEDHRENTLSFRKGTLEMGQAAKDLEYRKNKRKEALALTRRHSDPIDSALSKYLREFEIDGEENLLAKIQRELFYRVIQSTTNRTEASKVLGVSIKTLYERMKRYKPL